MSESSHEVTAAAAAGAAAAVQEVQDQQAQEETTEHATAAAEVAAVAATEATEYAAAATETSAEAIVTAEQANDTAQSAAIGLTEVYERVSQVEQKQEAFAGEVRSFFERLQEHLEKPSEAEVQQVEVTHNAAEESADKATGQTADSGTNAGSGRSASGERRSRHKFGR